jgi:GH35 family endo-1,4-beta-xylanase
MPCCGGIRSIIRLAEIALLGAIGAWTCAGPSAVQQGSPPPPPPADTIPLRTLAAARGLGIGAAVDRGFRYAGSDGATFRAKLVREFSMLTPENDMKHSRIHPSRDAYRFEPADSLVALAEANGMAVRGHTLVWHQQLASWLTAGAWSQDTAKALLADHIATVMGHYRGRVAAWDVVNEALADDGSLRPGFWHDRIGPDYIELAFRWAHEADSAVALFYNDYNIEEINAKSDSAYALIQRLLARGVPIHGIGLQAHFQLGGVPTTLAANIARFVALGLKVHITELDVRMPLPATAGQLETQAADYRAVLQACLLNAPACDAVVMWGFTDRESWVPGWFPGWGAALIFDAAYQPKPAFRALYQLLSAGP